MRRLWALIAAVLLWAVPAGAQFRTAPVRAPLAPLAPALPGLAAVPASLSVLPLQSPLPSVLPSLAAPALVPAGVQAPLASLGRALKPVAVGKVQAAPIGAASPGPAAKSLAKVSRGGTEVSEADLSSFFDGTRGAVKKPLKLLIAGPPGVGKTTQAKRLASDLGVVHISVGNLLREYAKSHPEIAEEMNRGDLVSNELVMDVVRERIAQPDVQEKGFIFDGFPRRQEELEAIQQLFGKDGVDAMIRMDAPEAELRGRILARGRADDTPKTFTNRMKVYREQTEPVIEQLEKLVPVIEPESTGPIETVYRSVVDGVRSWLQGLQDSAKKPLD